MSDNDFPFRPVINYAIKCAGGERKKKRRIVTPQRNAVTNERLPSRQ